jgi:hypothetical protein
VLSAKTTTVVPEIVKQTDVVKTPDAQPQTPASAKIGKKAEHGVALPKAAVPTAKVMPTTAVPQAIPQMPHAMQMQAPAQTLQLEDIHIPVDPPMWPPAPGWWLVLVLLLVAGAFIPARGYRYRKIRRQRQHILDALKNLQTDLLQQGDNKALANINRLLRRLALMFYQREQVASLTGKNWLAFLDKSGETEDFTQGAGQLLADAPYRPSLTGSDDIKELSKVVEQWVGKIVKEIRS